MYGSNFGMKLPPKTKSEMFGRLLHKSASLPIYHRLHSYLPKTTRLVSTCEQFSSFESDQPINNAEFAKLMEKCKMNPVLIFCRFSCIVFKK